MLRGSCAGGSILKETTFVVPPVGLALEPVHVWRLTGMECDLLSADEKAQADRYQSPQSRQAFIAGRSGIRRIAGIYTGRDPRGFRLSSLPEGKPFFENAGSLHFNVSHSGGEVVAAFSIFPIGIDIEFPGRCRDFAGIAQRFFHPEEASLIVDEDSFLRCWTAKEAMLKLAGAGISGGLASAQPGAAGEGMLNGQRVSIRRFCLGACAGAVASFQPFEVKGWFQI